MKPSLTEEEQKVIDILTNYEVTSDAHAAPIHAVDRAMGWATADTERFVESLINRKLIQMEPIVRHGPTWDPKSHWVKGEAFQN
jgi:hypothetical protein